MKSGGKKDAGYCYCWVISHPLSLLQDFPRLPTTLKLPQANVWVCTQRKEGVLDGALGSSSEIPCSNSTPLAQVFLMGLVWVCRLKESTVEKAASFSCEGTRTKVPHPLCAQEGQASPVLDFETGPRERGGRASQCLAYPRALQEPPAGAPVPISL